MPELVLESTNSLAGGFADPVMDSQAVFRTLLEAMAAPLTTHSLGSKGRHLPPHHPAALAICLALLDLDTPLWIQPGAPGETALQAFLKFHCGCPLVERTEAARFALIHDPLAMPPLSAFDHGTAEYPDRSATLIIQTAGFDAAQGGNFRGPGIRQRNRLGIAGLPAGFWDGLAAANAAFPLGLDCIFTAGDTICAAPRTTQRES